MLGYGNLLNLPKLFGLCENLYLLSSFSRIFSITKLDYKFWFSLSSEGNKFFGITFIFLQNPSFILNLFDESGSGEKSPSWRAGVF